MKRNKRGQFIKGFEYPKEWAQKRIRPKGLNYKIKKRNKRWFKKGCLPWNKGTKGICKANSTSFQKGQRISPETEFKSLQMKGKNNPRWKGGITPKTLQIRHSRRYIRWRKSVFERDNYTCQKCGERGRRLHAHHSINFYKLFGTPFQKYIFDTRNGVTLCRKCHHYLRKFA